MLNNVEFIQNQLSIILLPAHIFRERASLIYVEIRKQPFKVNGKRFFFFEYKIEDNELEFQEKVF